jgi:hypothetical protein
MYLVNTSTHTSQETRFPQGTWFLVFDLINGARNYYFQDLRKGAHFFRL